MRRSGGTNRAHSRIVWVRDACLPSFEGPAILCPWLFENRMLNNMFFLSLLRERLVSANLLLEQGQE